MYYLTMNKGFCFTAKYAYGEVMTTTQAIKGYSTRNLIKGCTIIVAPLCLLLGWLILMMRAGNGPDSGWFISHWLLILGVLLFMPVALSLRALLSNDTSLLPDIGVAASLLGSAALVGQFAIDLVIGLISNDQAAMSAFFRQISSAPTISLPFHLLGPVAFYGGLMTLIVLLMKHQSISSWNGMLAVFGIIAVGVQAVTGSALFALLGFAGILVGLVPIARVIVKGVNPKTY
jgi:hypothetical protein